MDSSQTAGAGVRRRPSFIDGRYVLAALAFIVVTLGSVKPFSPMFPGAGLDPSWIAALGEGNRLGWQWGRDIIFTYGPAINLVTHYFSQDYGLVMIVGFVLSAVTAALLASAWSSGEARASSIVPFGAMLVALLFAQGDAFYFTLIILTFLLAIHRVGSGRIAWSAVAGATILGVIAMSKASYGVVSIALFLLADLSALLHRRVPALVVPFLLAASATYLFYGQDPTALPYYAMLQREVVSGYPGAMSFAGPWREILVFSLVASAALATVIALEIRRWRASRDWLTSAALVAGLGLFGLAVFKAGFTRHDQHSLIAWDSFALAALCYATVRQGGLNPIPLRALALAGLTVMAVVSPLIRVAHREGGLSLPKIASVYERELISSPANEIVRMAAFASSPTAWFAAMDERKTRAFQAIRSRQDLPTMAGSVDVIPSMQSALLAHGLDYRPRPSFQEYGTYTSKLLETNRRHFASDRAPDWLIFSPDTIDLRHPGHPEGASWPEFLGRYRPESMLRGGVLLKRQTTPSPALLGPPEVIKTRLRADIPLPAGTPAFVRIRVKPSLLGRLQGLLYRPGMLVIVSTLADGSSHMARLIPGMAESGLVLSPLVDSPSAYVDLASNRTAEGRYVKSFQIVPHPGHRHMFDPDLEVEVQALNTSVLGQDVRPDIAAHYRRTDTLKQVMAQSGIPASHRFAIFEEGLVAQAPAAVPVNLPGKSENLRVGFGIKDDAWRFGSTDGACFRIKRAATMETVWEQCLEPRRKRRDRGEQAVTVPLGAAAGEALVFETACGANCDWDLTYWSRIDPN
ncbi:MAG TPA: hypothetical protein VIL09_12745 [Microvirga sp.]|jgi:hypothetical protein